MDYKYNESLNILDVSSIAECEYCSHPCDTTLRIDLNLSVPVNQMRIGAFVCPECGTLNEQTVKVEPVHPI